MQLAQVKNPIIPGDSLLNPISDTAAVTGFESILTVLVRVFLIAGSLLFVFIFIIGAIRWITSGGDKTQIESARNTILNAVIGLVILLSLFAIVGVIDRLFGLNILKINFDLLVIGGVK
ncbi:MAG: hypothetical protein Q7S60_03610 [bacterium]|nr:hypothetical protein [bacterium]